MSGAIRLALPLLTLVPGEMGGNEYAVRALITQLCRDDNVEVTGFVGAHSRGWLDGTGAAECVLEHVRGGASPRARLGAMVQGAIRPRPSRGIEAVADVVHYPFTVPVPPVRHRPTVVSLADVQHRDLPQFFSRAERVLRTVTYDRAARRADAVITLSEFSKQRIVAVLGIAAERVHVVPLAVSSFFCPDSSVGREDFVLYPARRWPHKNHGRLIEAVAMARADGHALRLVLTGGGPDVPAAPDWVEQRGAVSMDELLSLYRRAACLAVPSLYEGFGLPPLEGMATACPVVISGGGALEEVCGEAAVMCDPTDVRSIADAIVIATTESKRRVDLGLERAGGFTWRASADAHLKVFRALLP